MAGRSFLPAVARLFRGGDLDSPAAGLLNLRRGSASSKGHSRLTIDTEKTAILLKGAYSEAQMSALAAQSDFKSCEIVKSAVRMEVTLLREQPLADQTAGRFAV
jgi:hypothetical protein